MQRIFLIVLIMLLSTLFAAHALQAGETGLAGMTLGLKTGNISFLSNAAEDLDVDNGPYLGLELYRQISDRLHFGGEVGYSRRSGSLPLLKTELTYLPIELNLKSAVAMTPRVNFTLGGGVSYNYARIETDCIGTCFAADEEWHPGLQLFSGVQVNILRFLLGVEGKVQVSEEEDLGNWRLSAQAGYRF